MKNVVFKSDGTRETGAKIIKMLERLGGSNYNYNDGTGETFCYYYIGSSRNKCIGHDFFIPDGYELKDIHTFGIVDDLDAGFISKHEHIKFVKLLSYSSIFHANPDWGYETEGMATEFAENEIKKLKIPDGWQYHASTESLKKWFFLNCR